MKEIIFFTLVILSSVFLFYGIATLISKRRRNK